MAAKILRARKYQRLLHLKVKTLCEHKIVTLLKNIQLHQLTNYSLFLQTYFLHANVILFPLRITIPLSGFEIPDNFTQNLRK